VTAYAYAACGMILAGCAAYAFSVLRDRRRDSQPLPPWQRLALDAVPVPSPAHDAIPLSDDEEYAFAGLVLGYFQREDAP
jgi:hypothetical protein